MTAHKGSRWRKRSEGAYEALYTAVRHDQNNPFCCFYCGEAASTMDHQPPISRVDDYRSLGLRREVFLKVPCCEECNRLLGSELTIDLLERERTLKAALEKRYRALANSPYWSQRELNQLRGRLKEHVENHAARMAWLERRMDYSGGVQWYMDSLDDPESRLFLASSGGAEQ